MTLQIGLVEKICLKQIVKFYVINNPVIDSNSVMATFLVSFLKRLEEQK